VPDPLDELLARDTRFGRDAYLFTFECLRLAQQRTAGRRHVTGRELLDAGRELARDRYGLMARRVLAAWGITTTDDIGHIVFNLVDAGLMGKTDDDRIEDFHAVFDFTDAFDGGYEFGQAD
jgi:uncharacterized repeat protein (TIGR04138 family)